MTPEELETMHQRKNSFLASKTPNSQSFPKELKKASNTDFTKKNYEKVI